MNFSSSLSSPSTKDAGGSGGALGGMTNIVMRISRSWDIKMPPPTKTVGLLGILKGGNLLLDTGIGHLNIIQRKRKIVIEIHGPDIIDDKDNSGGGEVVAAEAEAEAAAAAAAAAGNDDVAAGDPEVSGSGSLSTMFTANEGSSSGRNQTRSTGSRRDLLHRTEGSLNFIDLSSELKDDDLIVIRILKPRRGRWGIHKDYTEEESESDSDNDNDNGNNSDKEEEEDEDGDCCNVTSSFLTSTSTKTKNKKYKKKQWLQDVLKERSASHNSKTSAHGGDGSLKNTKYTISREDTEWIEYRKFGLDEINDDDEQYRKTWEATIGIEKYRERRKMIFPSENQAIEFKAEINQLRQLSKRRSQQRLYAYKKLQFEMKSQTSHRLSLIQTGAGATATSSARLLSAGIIDTDHHHHHHHRDHQNATDIAASATTLPLNMMNVLNPINIVHGVLDLLPFEAVSTNPHGTTGVALQQQQQDNSNQNNDNNCNANQNQNQNVVVSNNKSSNSSVDNNSMTMMLDDNSNNNIGLNDDISLLVEIVSCSDLPVADTTSTDPYVVVFLGVNAIHKTEYIPKELNPVWTVHNGSLFMVSCSAEEFFSFSYGLVFCVKDFDLGLKDQIVGRAELTQEQLLYMDGERVAVELDIPQEILDHPPNRINLGKDRIYSSKIYLRVRKATPEDKKFIMTFNDIKRSKREGVYTDTSFKANADWMGILKRESKRIDGVEVHRVKPGPDPNRPSKETRWMSKSQIDEEMLKPSLGWVDSGNGTMGKIHIEVLKCENLPNIFLNHKIKSEKSKTDAFCCIVLEDAIGYTDVITDATHPRWMPWSQRAFAFNMAHPSSNLMIGVFDYDITGYHYLIGRVSVNLTNHAPRTEYVVSFDLYRSVMLDNDRQPDGKITIRIRIDFHDYRLTSYTLGAAAKLPDIHSLNLPNRFEFMTVYYVCHGDEDMNRFSLETLYAYLSELESHYNHVYEIRQAALVVIFWRGHLPLKIYGTELNLPIHSFVAFLMGITLVENLNLLPSYLLFSIAWFLMATYEASMKHPSPWAGSIRLKHMYMNAIYGKVRAFPESIAEYENEAAVRAYDEELKRRHEEEQEILKQRQETARQLTELYGQGATEPDDLSAIRVTKKDVNIVNDMISSVNPLSTSLLPIQQMLGHTASYIRILHSILSWDESIYAFLILNASIAVGIIFLFVPWGWIARWFFRLTIWIFLGPWMKLVDLYVLPKIFGTELDKDKMLANFAKDKLDSIGITKENILRKREDVYKRQAMKRYMFGKYSVMVPRFKDYRYCDTPLPESSATPVLEDIEIITNKIYPGQTLTGEMIPTWGDGLDKKRLSKGKKSN